MDKVKKPSNSKEYKITEWYYLAQVVAQCRLGTDSSGEGVETSTLVGPLERANLTWGRKQIEFPKHCVL
jgi:hypothetical protein